MCGLPESADAIADKDELPETAELGRYMVVDKLGEGGMGVVYRAYDGVLRRDVALKVLTRARLRRADPAAAQARLMREAQAMAQLAHPNVITVYDAQTDGRTLYVAMELVEGETLKQWLAQRRGWREVVDAFTQAGRGLAAAHGAGLVHRDFKPANVMLDGNGRVRVLDFGLARAFGADSEASATISRDSHDAVPQLQMDVTARGVVLGTPAYMSPEQHMSDPATARSDQYSFCVALFEALYGQRPFAAQSGERLVRAKAFRELGDVSRRGVPAALWALCLRGLDPDPERRWPSMADLVERIERVPVRARRRSVVFGISTIALVGGAVGIGTHEDLDGCDPTSELEAHWGDTQRDEVAAAIEATELAYADETRIRVTSVLDEYAAQWGDTYRSVCERVEKEEGTQLRRAEASVACLRRRLGLLDAYVAQLTEVDTKTLARASRALADLPSVDRCLDDSSFAAAVDPPGPEIAQRVTEAQRGLDRIRALRSMGHYAEAVALARDVLADAQDIGYAPLLGDAQQELGRGLSEQGDYEEARDLLLDSYFAAVEAGDDPGALERAAMLVHMYGISLDEPDEAQMWRRQVAALSQQVSVPEMVAWAETAYAAALRKAGRFDEALPVARNALSQADQIYPEDSAKLFDYELNYAGTLAMSGQREEAAAILEQVLVTGEKAYGPSHPRVAVVRVNLGDQLRILGENERALAHLDAAMRSLEASQGPDHIMVGQAAVNLGLAREETGDIDAAIALWQRAAEIFEAKLGPDTPQLGAPHSNLGRVLTDQGKHEEAAEHLRKSLRVRVARFGDEHPKVATSLVNLAVNRRDAGVVDEAIEHLERVVPILEKAHGGDHEELAHPLMLLAEALETERGCEEAMPQYLRSLDVIPASRRDDHKDAKRARAGIARCAAPDG